MRRGRQPRERERGRDGGRGRRQTDSRDRWRERSTHARWRLRNSARVLSAVAAAAAAVTVSSRDSRSQWCTFGRAVRTHREESRIAGEREAERDQTIKAYKTQTRAFAYTRGLRILRFCSALYSVYFLPSVSRSLARSLARARIPDSPKDGPFLSHLCSRRRTSRTVLDTRFYDESGPEHENTYGESAVLARAVHDRLVFP